MLFVHCLVRKFLEETTSRCRVQYEDVSEKLWELSTVVIVVVVVVVCDRGIFVL